MMGHWALLALLLVHLVRCSENDDLNVINVVDSGEHEPEYTPSWTFTCYADQGCQRSEKPLPTNVTSQTSGNVYESADICRSVCGRFGGIWPRPVTAALSMQTVKIHPNFLRFDLIDVPAETRSLLVDMTHVTTNNLLAECGGNVTDLVDTPVVVYITVKTSNLVLDWETNEYYMLDVQARGRDITVHIVGETVYGVRHALETFTQLVASSRPEFSNDKLCALHMVAGAKVRDRPVYKHRGFLLDTSRNFIPMEDVKRMIDGMAATKMNVFHWHITDSHSFPLESPRVPQFTKYGAYSPSEIYTVQEVWELVKYAQIRGVRVIIEIDAPAHAGNGWQWGKDYGYGDLAVCVNSNKWRQLCIQPPCGQLNPANEAMYRVLRDLYKDIAEMLPKPALLHMGGDEVYFGCWNSSQEIVNYMRDKGFETDLNGYIRLWAEFHAKALQIWDEEYQLAGGEAKPPVMLWSSELTQMSRIQNFLDKSRYIIEVWETVGSPLLTQLLRMGYRAVSVPKDVWYLDHGFWGSTQFSNWRKMYSHQLVKDSNLLGGEVAMWSELIDANVLDTRVWPRAAAVAERLWTDPTSLANAAEPRLQRLRSRMIARGLRPDALSPAWCSQHDNRCL